MSRVWWYPAAGFGAAAAWALAPGSPVGPDLWPSRGAFGAFTWSAWFAATGLGLTLLLLAAGVGRRRGAGGRRALPAALAYGLLASSAFTAAARAEAMARSPGAALALAVFGLVALRSVAAGLAPAVPGAGRAE